MLKPTASNCAYPTCWVKRRFYRFLSNTTCPHRGETCPPVSITLNDFEDGVTYYLYKNNDVLVATDDGFDGT